MELFDDPSADAPSGNAPTLSVSELSGAIRRVVAHETVQAWLWDVWSRLRVALEADAAKPGSHTQAVLEGVGSREEQLSVAREYLKAEGHSPEALRHVTRELHEAREIAQSQRGHDEGIDHA